MTRHYLTYAIFLGCMLVAFTEFASADIVQCIDDTGAVTYTDVPCRNGADAARSSGLSTPSAFSANSAPPARIVAIADEPREAVAVMKRMQRRGLALDVATLQAARSSMLLTDQASSVLRQQKLASIDQKNQRWFAF
jgi:hypothetical protein